MRGRNIHPPANLPVRPTTDFAKSALFNILNNYFNFEDLRILDLFAGAGSISYEFASRNGNDITAVDESFHCISFIKKTAEEMNIRGIKCYRADAFKFIRKDEKKYDIIFADPPFNLNETDSLPDLIFEKKLLNDGGWLIIEHQSKRVLDTRLQASEIRKYGNCAFSIFKNIPAM